jgi:hypothetical protein
MILYHFKLINMKASEAKELADNYAESLESVLKWITHRAKEGARFTYVKASEETVTELLELGYGVELNCTVNGVKDCLVTW